MTKDKNEGFFDKHPSFDPFDFNKDGHLNAGEAMFLDDFVSSGRGSTSSANYSSAGGSSGCLKRLVVCVITFLLTAVAPSMLVTMIREQFGGFSGIWGVLTIILPLLGIFLMPVIVFLLYGVIEYFEIEEEKYRLKQYESEKKD